MGRVNCDHIKRLITLTSDNIKRLSLYFFTYTLFSLFSWKTQLFPLFWLCLDKKCSADDYDRDKFLFLTKTLLSKTLDLSLHTFSLFLLHLHAYRNWEREGETEKERGGGRERDVEKGGVVGVKEEVVGEGEGERGGMEGKKSIL